MRRIFLLLGTAMLIAACGEPAAMPTATVPPPDPTAPAAGSPVETAPEPEPQPTKVDVLKAEDELSAVQERDELTATDPTTVSLGNGSPTLVEFFAFW
jgi:hypothetical protein